ncbi:MAG: MBL fold metallo-hydrolase [Candidatus Dormibacteraeota bacterium]|nr:MBL fold metallo-hydrolase [Candidatus Dormibacteraeota bacterium]
MVDGHILLDAGAPLLPHMHRLGLDPAAIDVAFISHFHGDHVLGLPTYVLHRAFVSQTPLTIVGPQGVGDRMEELFYIAWGTEWKEIRERLQVVYQDAGRGGSAAGVEYETVQLDHGTSGCTGYRLRLDGRVLAYSGDTVASPPLEDLIRGSDVAIVEATAPGDPYSHLSWAQAAQMRARHPGTRFVFNHVFEGDLEGAAEDLTVIEV